MDLQVYIQKACVLALWIADAEGFNVPGSVPQRIHNPGDLELDDRGWGIYEGKTIFPKADFKAYLDDKTDGASALKRDCLGILIGSSHEISPYWTFTQLSVKWTGNQNAEGWCKTVCKGVGASPDETLKVWSGKHNITLPVDSEST